ncbi:MAG TPA: putative Ig domain-containing protein [Candidatus Sulfotelmatobacter sp.]|nr:putative Ig domain-containing protein [Candidatus Sulfotelmatobacter sp.]
MIGSEALPPARQGSNWHVTPAAGFVALFAVIASVLWLTSCTGVSSGPGQNSNPIVVSVTPPAASIRSSASQQFTAMVSNTSNTGVNWSASQGSISASGVYTAPTVTANTKVTITATSMADSSQSGTASLTITPSSGPPPLIIVTSSLSAATSGTAYSTSLSASGGVSPYSWALYSGVLPTGITLHSNGTLSGTTTQTGPFTFTVQVTDSSSTQESASQSLSLTVSNSAPPALSITTSSLPAATTGAAYSTSFAASGGTSPYTWAVSSGVLPAGIALQSSGTLSGTTTQTGQFAFTVQITDSSSTQQSATKSFNLTVNNSAPPPLSITTSSLAAATTGTAYSTSLAASGGTSPYTWALSSGVLPTGIALQSSGTLSGTTTQTGQFTFTVQVTDSSSTAQSTSKSFNLAVNSSTTGNAVSLSFFGADFNGGGIWPPTDGLSQNASLGSLRLWDDGVKWSDLNSASGVYDWTGLDSWLSKAQSSNLDVLYTFGATPQYAATNPPPAGCLSPGIYSCAPPSDLNADGTGTDAYFSAFVTALVTHAAGRISYYELWNEADSPGFWGGTTAQIVRMGKDAASIIHSLDPNAKILSPSAHGQTMATWFDGYIVAGGAPNFDIVNVHMRGAGLLNINPEEFLNVYGQVETELTAQNLTSLPLWDDEHGIRMGDGLTDPDMLAGYVARSAILRAGVGIQRQYIYSWDSVVPYGLQGNASGTAWDQVASWLIGHSISPCVANGTIYTCQLDNGQIVWDTAQSCSNGVCTTSSYSYPSQYSYSHDIAGTRTALTGSTVQIGYKPILLESQ